MSESEEQSWREDLADIFGVGSDQTFGERLEQWASWAASLTILGLGGWGASYAAVQVGGAVAQVAAKAVDTILPNPFTRLEQAAGVVNKLDTEKVKELAGTAKELGLVDAAKAAVTKGAAPG